MSKRKNELAIKFCIVCGKRIPETSNRHKICSDRCARKRKNLHRRGMPAPYENAIESPAQAHTLAELNAEARKLGLTYGQYMQKRNSRQQ